MNAEPTNFEFKPATRENVNLLIALAGASGSGKTYSALELASGISPSGRIAFLDTEARRALHYADTYTFQHADMRPPFRPQAFIDGIHAAEAAGAEVVVIDSASHEYDGEGGILDWADQLAAGGTKPPGNWKAPKLAHKKMMNALLQARCHIIFCLRAEEKIKWERDEATKKIVAIPLGWIPICEKRFMFEMTLSLTLRPDDPGTPHYDLPHKIQAQHRAMFPEGEHISAAAGKSLAAWAHGANPAAVDLLTTARAKAKEGEAAFTEWYDGLSKSDQKRVDAVRRTKAAGKTAGKGEI